VVFRVVVFKLLVWCGAEGYVSGLQDAAFSLICGNKMPTRYNRGFYCRSYCVLNMFRVSLCPSSGAQKYYTVVAACGISCCDFQVVGLVWICGLCMYVCMYATIQWSLWWYLNTTHNTSWLPITIFTVSVGVARPLLKRQNVTVFPKRSNTWNSDVSIYSFALLTQSLHITHCLSLRHSFPLKTKENGGSFRTAYRQQ